MTTDSRADREARLTAWGAALAFHLALAAALLVGRGDWPQVGAGGPGSVSFRLMPPAEGPRSSLVASVDLPGRRDENAEETVAPPESEETQPPPPDEPPAPPENRPPAPTPPPPPAGGLDEETMQALEQEREMLLAQLDQQRGRADQAADGAARSLAGALRESPAPARSPVQARGPVGTVRQLDLGGHPEAVVQEIMDRYKLRVTEKALAGGATQNFLSSASTADGGQFNASRGGAPGIYQVFLLSPGAVAAMSRLEEEAIRSRGMDPMRTRVERVKFGIVTTEKGPDLGVLLLVAKEI